MVYWFESVLLYITSCLVHSYGVDPTRDACLNKESDYHITRACECVVYQSYGLSSGRFYSPNYPEPYRHSINCILYTFIGDVNEIVEIDFIDMDLKSRVKMSPTYYECKDFIRVYKNLDRPEVNENSRVDDELCGNISELPQKKFYSQGRGLILEFHTDKESRETHKGFKGVFRFLDKSIFRTDGTSPIGSRCSWNIQSFHNNTRGDFYSPRFPQNYPQLANCHYMFHGHSSESLNITFKIVRLPSRGHRSCEDSGDSISIYDGKDNTSELLARFCETHHNPKPIFSSGPYVYIEFKSDRHNQLQGFAAEYTFINKRDIVRDEGKDVQNNTGHVEKCNRVIESVNGHMSGTIISPGYPSDYPSSMVCKYIFKGEGQQRVQITFLDMNLHYTGRGAAIDPFQCSDQGDTITVIIYIDDEKKELGEYCGQKKPPVLMSNGVKMEVVFKSDSKMKNGVSGYKFEYKFKTDFGVQGNGIQDTREACAFQFNSTRSTTGVFTSPNYPGFYPRSCVCKFYFFGGANGRVNISFETFELEKMNGYSLHRVMFGFNLYLCTFTFRSRLHTHGYFTSPNFGGLYPRNTVCRFLFSGRRTNEKVQIEFDDFYVDGIRPSCTEGDDSDSLSFSNYWNSEDRKMPRYCGLSLPGMVQSDGTFFLVTFRSNAIYDATGFKARYTFISSDESEDIKEPPSKMDQTSLACRSTAPISLLTLLTCTVLLALKL